MERIAEMMNANEIGAAPLLELDAMSASSVNIAMKSKINAPND